MTPIRSPVCEPSSRMRIPVEPAPRQPGTRASRRSRSSRLCFGRCPLRRWRRSNTGSQAGRYGESVLPSTEPSRGSTMSTVVAAMFACPLGEDAALLPRTAAITEAYHELLVANRERLARWEPWAAEAATLDSTRSFLEASGRAWLEGTELPVAIAVPADDGWQLVGSAGLRINRYDQSANGGYWIDSSFEGRGLVTRAMTTLLDQAFGPLGLARVALHTDVGNQRSRAVAERLGFTEEGINRQALAFHGGRRDQVVYGLLAGEWQTTR